MQIIFRSGKWPFTLRITQALSAAGVSTQTDTKGRNGQYSIAVDMREVCHARRIIAETTAGDIPGRHYTA